jgi:hypothetical protein
MAEARVTAIAAHPAASGGVADAGPTDVLDALQTLLQVEYLQTALYGRAAAATGLVPTSDVAVFSAIGLRVSAQLTTLTTAIRARTGIPAASPIFDFTVKGALPGFTFAVGQYPTLQMVAQAVGDFAVRAYVGQLAALATDKGALNAALAILAVKGRIASEVRRLRGKKGWITGSSRDDLPAFAQPIYDGEDNVTQSAINLTAAAKGFGDAASASEAFDEPLTKAQVAAILALFVA